MDNQHRRPKAEVHQRHRSSGIVQRPTKWLGWLVPLVVVSVLAACSGVDEPTVTPTPTATPIPVATPTPTPAPTPTPTPVPGPQEVTSSYLAAFNAGDVEALRDIYADDVVFTLGNLPYGPTGQPITDSHVGKGAVIDENLQSIAANARITLSDADVVGNALRGGFSYTDDDKIGSLGPLTDTLETVVLSGEITSVTMTFDGETYQRWKAVIAPVPVPPIAFGEEATGQDIMEQLPAEEGECIRRGLGDMEYSQFLRSDFSQDSEQLENDLLSRCLSNESISRFFIGYVVIGLGGLADASIACMSNALSEHDLKTIFFDEVAWGEAFQAMVGCLNDEESARAEASGFFEGDEEEIGSPGLVDVGDGRQLYLTCQGEGSPTVVMETGGAGHSESWRFVKPDVTKFTHVCAYDRSGTGRSSSLPPHGTIQAIAEELHALLAAAGVHPPYVLVGHSLGGIIIRQFVTQYPDEIVGMVMVDTSSGDPRDRLQAVLTPEEWQLYGNPGHDADMVFPDGADFLGPDLADIPLVVLSAGIVGRDAPPDVAERINNVRLEMHQELLDLSSNSSHVIAEESDHGIPRNQPELVVDAIQWVVEEARSR